MIARLLSYTIKQQLIYTFSNISTFKLFEKYPRTHTSEFSYALRFLNVKVYDTGTVVDATRVENNHDDTTEKAMENVSMSSRINTRDRKVRSDELYMDVRDKILPKQAMNKWRLETDDEVFGNAEVIEDNEVDSGEEDFVRTRHVQKLNTKEYARLIKDHLNAHRLKDAIAVLEHRMLKEDHVKPENYIYNLLISGCAKAGYTRKAFNLFSKMRQRGLRITGGTYTSLLNACSKAPSPSDGLEKLHKLREIMLEKGYTPNAKNYHAMIKAYGRCGDTETAYLLADEMIERKIEVTTETFNFLLQACASDTKFGFRYCLLTWHKMLMQGIRPDYYSFNTVLRCVRDCGLGDLVTTQQLLAEIINERHRMYVSNNVHQNNEIMIHKEIASDQLADATSSIQDQTNKTSMLRLDYETAKHLDVPNLLALRPNLSCLIALSEVTQPHERFLLIGGLDGFLQEMKFYTITPDIKTFTTMLEVIPHTNAAEKKLISFIKKIGLKADIDFFNILIKKRSMRFDYNGAKEVLSMIRTAKLKPDIVTYGVLALGCTTEESARELLYEMVNNDIRMNIQILGAMLRQGCAHKSFSYIMEVMQISLDECIRPNEAFLRTLHKFNNQCARAIDARHPFTKRKDFKKYEEFQLKLRLYYEENGILGLKLDDAIKQIQEKPYDKYKEIDVNGIEPLKNEKLAKKNKIRKYIKKIKDENLHSFTISGEKHNENLHI